MSKEIRTKSFQLKFLEALNARTNLPYTQQQYLLNLKKGYEGEKQFDEWIHQYMEEDSAVVKDLLISYNGSTAQIDALIVSGNSLYIYEIKNYEGEYLKLTGQLKKLNGQEFICPSVQLNRTKKILQQMINQWTDTIEVYGYVVFINPSFLLYEVQPSDPFIFWGQLKKHFSDLKKNQTKSSKQCISIVNKLQSEQATDKQFTKTSHDYKYEEMKKGITCCECRSFNVKITQRQVTCQECQSRYSIEQVIVDHIDEMSTLFPALKVTTSTVYDWMNGEVIKRRIGRLLKTLKDDEVE